jgi:magnesium-transporting ATPase (P-type)
VPSTECVGDVCCCAQVQEAMLTGESVPISKNLRAVAEASGLGDRKCMAFSATTVSAGQGLGVITATGRPGQMHACPLVGLQQFWNEAAGV